MVKDNNFGKFFDNNPKYNKILNYYSGNQAKKVFQRDIQSEQQGLRQGGYFADTAKGHINDDKSIMKKLNPQKIYSGEQLHSLKIFGPQAPLTEASRHQFTQSVHKLAPNDPELSKLVDTAPRNKIGAALKIGNNPMVRVIGKSMDIKLHRAKPFYSTQKYNRLSKYLHYNYANSINRVLHNWNQSAKFAGVDAHYKPSNADRSLAHHSMKYALMSNKKWNQSIARQKAEQPMSRQQINDISRKVDAASHTWSSADVKREQEQRAHAKKRPFIPNMSVLDSKKVEQHANHKLHQLHGKKFKLREKVHDKVINATFDNRGIRPELFKKDFAKAVKPLHKQAEPWIKIKALAMRQEAKHQPIHAPKKPIMNGSYATEYDAETVDHAKNSIKHLRRAMHRPKIWDNYQIQRYLDTHQPMEYVYKNKKGQMKSYTKNDETAYVNDDYGDFALEGDVYKGLRGTASSVKSGGFFRALRQTYEPQAYYSPAQRKTLDKKLLKRGIEQDKIIRRQAIDRYHAHDPHYTLENKMKGRPYSVRKAIDKHDLADETEFSKVIKDEWQNPTKFMLTHHNLYTRLYLTVDGEGHIRDKNYKSRVNAGPYTRENLLNKVHNNMEGLNQKLNGGVDMRVDESREHDPHYTESVKQQSLTDKQIDTINEQDFKDLRLYKHQLSGGVHGAYYLDQHPNVKTRLQVSTNHGRVTRRDGSKPLTVKELGSKVDNTLKSMSSKPSKAVLAKYEKKAKQVKAKTRQGHKEVQSVTKGQGKKAQVLRRKATQRQQRKTTQNRNRNQETGFDRN